MRDVSRGSNEHQVPESMLTIIFNRQDHKCQDQDQDVAPQPNTTRLKKTKNIENA